jgi:hypothetical protein
MRLARLVIPLLSALVACEGPVGPMGPEGPPGVNGSVVRYTASGVLGSGGTAIHELPEGIGAADDLPVLTCYLSPDGTTWFAVMDGYSSSTPYCSIEVLPGGVLAVRLSQGTQGWSYYIAVAI